MIVRPLALAVALLATSLGAQAPAAPPNAPGRLVGRVVVAGTEIPLSYAVIAIPALQVERFTDATGAFVIGGVPAGAHHVRIRHVGYEPRDTTVVVPSGAATEPLVIGLPRVAVQLATVRVRARRDCTRPGPPDARVDPVGAAVFEQVKQNAERARLLAERHSYLYRMERSFADEHAGAPLSFSHADTIVVTSARTWRYAPGQLAGFDALRRERVVRVPTLPDLADDAFVRAHCFDYAGLDTLHGRAMARMNVMPRRGLPAPDIGGAVFLDSADYQIRFTDFALTTNRDRRQASVLPMRMVTQFQDVLSALPIVSSIRAVTSYPQTVAGQPIARVEQQYLLDFQWTGTPP